MKYPLLILLLFAGYSAHAEQISAEKAVRALKIDMPRAYGFFVGDLVQQRIRFTTRQSFSLSESALPEPGPLNYWLDLKAVKLDSADKKAGYRYDLLLTYQLFYTPLVVTARKIPGFSLSLTDARNNKASLHIPAWEFFMSPVKPIARSGVAMGADSGLAPLADLGAPLHDTRAYLAQIFALVVLLLLLILLYLWRAGLLFSKRQFPFKHARKLARAIKAAEIDDPRYLAAMRATHHAFNQCAGVVLFSGALERFFAERAEFAPFRSAILSFYTTSLHVFYGQPLAAGQTPMSATDLAGLCHDLCGFEAAQNKSAAP